VAAELIFNLLTVLE